MTKFAHPDYIRTTLKLNNDVMVDPEVSMDFVENSIDFYAVRSGVVIGSGSVKIIDHKLHILTLHALPNTGAGRWLLYRAGMIAKEHDIELMVSDEEILKPWLLTRGFNVNPDGIVAAETSLILRSQF